MVMSRMQLLQVSAPVQLDDPSVQLRREHCAPVLTLRDGDQVVKVRFTPARFRRFLARLSGWGTPKADG